MRKRNGRKSRSMMVLDLRKLYSGGVVADLFAPIELPPCTELNYEIQFCEEILRSHPDHIEAMVVLGDAYTRNGEFQKGLDLDLRLSQLRPENKLIRYNLACSYALTGQKEKALNSLSKAVQLGYNDIEHVRQDHDLDTIKNDPRFRSLIEKMSGETRETSHQG